MNTRNPTKKDPSRKKKVWIVTSESEQATWLKALLHKISPNMENAQHFEITHLKCLQAALVYLKKYSTDVILLNLDLSDSQGIITLTQVYKAAPTIPIIVLAACDDTENDVMENGAQDFLLTTALDPHTLRRTLFHAIKRQKHCIKVLKKQEKKLEHSHPIFTYGMEKNIKPRLKLETALAVALERNEFFLVYQPKFNLKTNKITGVETLLRWKQPELGLVSPNIFIPIAEETNVIDAIDEWVLQSACQQCVVWKSLLKHDFTIAVNISPQHLSQPTFTQHVKDILKKTHLPAHYLILEVTETAIMIQSHVEDALTDLYKIGIRIDVDDFGTGYSSFSHLKYLPIHAVKIDKMFVDDVSSDKNDSAIVISIINLAKSMGLKVIAEGIETESQLQFLISHGCQQGQGMYLSPPISEEKMKVLLKQQLT